MMPARRLTPRRCVDAGGADHRKQGQAGAGTWVLAGAVVVTLLCLGLSTWLTFTPVEVPTPAELERSTPAAGWRTPTERRGVAPPRAPAMVQKPLLRKPAARPEPARVATEEERDEGTPGEFSGLALFPLPGTKPHMEGLLVPEDFELPPGYVRHYQVTDDGKQLPAILVFHPDYTPKDEQGREVPISPNRVVPPELAPPGLPMALLEVGKPGSGEPAP